MELKTTYQRALIALGVVALIGAGVAVFSDSCVAVRTKRPVMGSQGYRIFVNDVIKSFDHNGRTVCVPDGWIPVGEVSRDERGAVFSPGETAVLIKQEAFAGRTIRPEGSSYEVTVLYPLSTPKGDVTKYLSIIERDFTGVAAFFDDVPKERRVPHTVLVTAGILGNTQSDNTRMYPDPTATRSIFVRSPDQDRAEELMLHAVVHLYNRYHILTNYTGEQKPFSPEEFEELEATWAEVALSENKRSVFSRLSYLYKVHTAVVTQNHTLITEPPFTDVEGFKRIVPTVFVRESANPLDYQYGHYVLLPLTMAAVDALLKEEGGGLTLKRLLRDIHAGRRTNLMQELEAALTPKSYKNVERWLKGDAQIPFPLIERAIGVYGQ